MRWLIYGMTTFFIIAAVYILVRPEPLPVETVTVAYSDFEETLTAEGRIRSKTKVTVYASATGNISKVGLRIGDAVQKNQILTLLIWDKDTPVRSPIAGVISKIFRDSAGPIARGEPILEILNPDELEVVSDVLTTDAVRLAVNGQAEIINWGGEAGLNASIQQISKAGVVKVSALGVEEERTEVRLRLAHLSPAVLSRLGDNFHVDVHFHISKSAHVMTIPLGALFKSGQEWAVYKNDAGRATLQIIQIGKRNDKVAIVTQGLQPGDKVIMYPSDKISDGIFVSSP